MKYVYSLLSGSILLVVVVVVVVDVVVVDFSVALIVLPRFRLS